MIDHAYINHHNPPHRFPAAGARPFDATDSTDQSPPTGGEEESLPVVLALRKWASFHRSMHFRCFIRGHALVGAWRACLRAWLAHETDVVW